MNTRFHDLKSLFLLIRSFLLLDLVPLAAAAFIDANYVWVHACCFCSQGQGALKKDALLSFLHTFQCFNIKRWNGKGSVHCVAGTLCSGPFFLIERTSKQTSFSSFSDSGCFKGMSSRGEKTVQEQCTNIQSKQNCTNATHWLSENVVWLPLLQPFGGKRLLMQFSFVKNDFVCRVFCVQHCRVFWSTWCE